MVIVKMNNTTVECSIAASELREIGLTPEAVINGEQRSEMFMEQLNHEMGEQLGYNPETEVLMMSKNIMGDGSVHIFAMKMTDEDIETSAARVREAAKGLLKLTSQRKLNALKGKSGKEKGLALSEMLAEMSGLFSQIYQPQSSVMEEPQIEASSKHLLDVEKYLVQFNSLEECGRFARVVSHLPVIESTLYKEKGRYGLVVLLYSGKEGASYEMRRLGLEYAGDIQLGSAELTHLEETAQCLIRTSAIERLIELEE